MPLTAPKTYAVGEVLTAADQNTYLRDNVKWLATDKPRCRVYNNADISVANATATALTFNSERYDVGGCHSTSTSTSRLTVPADTGVYAIFGHVGFVPNNAGVRQVYIRLNGATILASDSKMAVTTGIGTELSVYTEFALVAGWYVELVVAQSCGTALNVDSANFYSPEFGMRWVATV